MINPTLVRVFQGLSTTFRGGSVLVGLAMVVTGIAGILNARGFAQNFGLPVPSPHTQAAEESAPASASKRSEKAPPSAEGAGKSNKHETAPSPWIAVAAVRNLALGLLNLALAWRADWQMLGLVYLCCVPIAAVDGWAVRKNGVREKHMSHTPGVVILPFIAWAINLY